MSRRLIVVGGGIVGTWHAVAAIRRGWEVVQLERERAARGASVRNFGLIWVSGRRPGAHLELALDARRHWEEIAPAAPGIGFRPNGSLTVARSAEEQAVLEEAVAQSDAADRSLKLLTPAEARSLNPALRGEVAAALWCELDAVVEPRAATAALQGWLSARPRYLWVGGTTVLGLDGTTVIDHRGRRHEGDAVLVCTGASFDLLGGVDNGPLQRCRLQMLQTGPHGRPLTTSVADGDSLRYYPAYQLHTLDRLPTQHPLAAAHRMQLLVAQRLDGSLTIGDTHAYDEPFDFDLDEAPTRRLVAAAAAVLGGPLPPVQRRWAGVYAQCTDPLAPCFRHELAPGVIVVTGLAGAGMTLSPAVAEQTLEALG